MVSALSVDKTVPTLWNCLCVFVKDQLAILVWVHSGFSIMLH